MRTLRIFISSPGDVRDERDRARRVVETLRRRYSGRLELKHLLWEDLPLQPDMSFQQGIDAVLSSGQGVDIAVFILWSRLGSPVGSKILKPDGSGYRSGTEREFHLLVEARAASGGTRPDILFYIRKDETSYEERFRGSSTAEKQELLDQKKLVDAFVTETFKDAVTGANSGAWLNYESPAGFQNALRTHLESLLDRLAGGGRSAPLWDTRVKGAPYRGLEAFQPEHADVFFGREEEIMEARRALREQARHGCAFLLLSGSSGSGKSSLARAGLLPAIIENEIDDDVPEWLSLIVTPAELGGDPVVSLVRRLVDESVLPQLAESPDAVSELASDLKINAALTCRRTVKPVLNHAAKKKGAVRLLLVIDQLEELFASQHIDPSGRGSFLDVIEAFARSGSIWVLATCRADFHQQVQAEPALVRMRAGIGQLDVLAPAADSLRRLVEEPSRRAGLQFETRDGQSLSDVILRDAACHAELLPLVEFVLRELYEQRSPEGLLSWSAYRTLGGVEGALARCADKVFANLAGEARDALGSVLTALVALSQDSSNRDADKANAEQLVRQPAALESFPSGTPARVLIDAFVASRLFTAGKHPETGKASVSVAHESLLRVWRPAVAWVAGNRSFLRRRERLNRSYQAWLNSTPPRHSDFLLPSGVQLAEGVDLLKRHPDLFKEEGPFIRASVRRHKAKRYSLASAIVLIVVASGAYYLYTEKQRTDDAQATAKQRTRDAQAGQLAEEAGRYLTRKDYARAEIAAAGSLTFRDSPATRRLLLNARSGGIEFLTSSAAESSQVKFTTFSGDGKLAASIPAARAGTPPHLSVISTDGRVEKWRIPNPDGVPDCMAFSNDTDGTRFLAVAGADHGIILWKLANGQPPQLHCALGANGDPGRHTKRVPSLAFHPSRPWIATCSEDEKLCLWDYSAKAPRLIWEQMGAHDTAVHGIAFNSDGSLLASGGGDYMVKVWTLESMSAGYDGAKPYVEHQIEPLHSIGGHTDSVFAVAFSPDGKRLASGGYDRVVRLWDLGVELRDPKAQPPAVGTLYGHEGTVLDMAFSDDSKLLISGGKDETVRVWVVSEGRLLTTLTPACGVIRSVACRSFDDNIHCGGENGWSLWSARGGSILTRLWNGGATIGAIAFDPGGKFVAAGGNDGRVRIWNEQYHPVELETAIEGESINGLVVSPDGRWLAAAGEGRTVHVWENRDGWKKVMPPSGSMVHSGGIWGMCFDPGGKWLATGNTGTNRRIRIWRMTDWSLAMESEQLLHSPYALACDPDGKFLISGDSAGQVILRDAATLKILKTTENVRAGEKNVWSLAVCPEPLSILSGNSDGQVYRWVPGISEWDSGAPESKTGTSAKDAIVNPTVNSVSYSPKHRWIASGGDGASVEIYDASLKQVQSLGGHEGTIWYVAFDPSGDRLACGGVDRILRIWNFAEMHRTLTSESPEALYRESAGNTGLTVDDGGIEFRRAAD